MILFKLFSLFLPWPLRRLYMRWFHGYDLHPTSYIGLSWVFPSRLVMGPFSRIDHLTVCKDLGILQMGEKSSIGRLNWITGFPAGHPRHFSHQPDRRPELILGDHAAITNRHLLDCTNRVSIGAYSTLAGFRTQILTHSIDIMEGRQSSAPISIGNYCFIGTDAIILGGSQLPDFCILGAKSLLNKPFQLTHRLYAGVPAREVKAMEPGARYFNRVEGFVY